MSTLPHRLDRTVLIHAQRETDGQERARGTNVFLIGPRGLFESVTGFWNTHPRT